MPRVISLHIYPLKAAAVIDLQSSRLTPLGLDLDRHWLIVDPAGHFITQRSDARLARLATRLDGQSLWLNYPGVGELQLPIEAHDLLGIESPTALQKVRVWKRDILALDAGDAAAAFVSTILQRPARLVRASKENFSDGYPLLVCSRESLAALNAELPQALPMNRFRPNIVIEGLPAWQEDRIETLRIGQAVWIRPVKACTRCGVTGIDQQTGLPSNSPLEVLRRLRFDPVLRGVTFGQNAKVLRGFGEEIRVGDSVQVTLRPEPQAAGPAPSPGL